MDRARFNWIIKAIEWDKLTDWEEQYLQSCDSQLKKKNELSEKQIDIIERIFREKQ